MTEADTQRAVLDYLAAKRILHRRFQTGALRNAAGRPVRFGKKGDADILAFTPDNRPVWIEVKGPDPKRHKQSDAQKERQAEIERYGQTYLLVRSVDEVIRFFGEQV